ncbi:MAG: hypothetical protein K2G14_00050 [Ruminococcus sp.]|nr:hypothetical protein [Ruminococcus sp.]
MKWIDGSNIDIKNFSGAEICERLSLEMWDIKHSEWSSGLEEVINKS